ncbi:hypothetical protein ACH4T9_12840 [Micromonospora sp. NPDC020750]|uniref:hypothetical protein n=1 Tax=unclassified Micromonospora TaxID=2617518 RepID=UPI0037A16225
MASFAQDHSAWQQAQEDAATTGSAADRAEAQRLRQQLDQHPAVADARKAVKGRQGKAGR